jgi:hypothetical protein
MDMGSGTIRTVATRTTNEKTGPVNAVMIGAVFVALIAGVVIEFYQRRK